MFIELKDLKKKRNIALLTVISLIFSGVYLIINNKGNVQRVESVIYTDKTISEKFGEIRSYSIRRFGSDHYSSPERLLYAYFEITEFEQQAMTLNSMISYTKN